MTTEATVELVTDMVARHARLDPAAPAVEDGSVTVTYGQLDAAANRIANRLIALGGGPGEFVGIPHGAGAVTAAAQLGIMRAGAAFVPLDPHATAARREAVIDDACIRFTAGAADAMPAVSVDFDGPVEPDPGHARRGGLAYALYTSGSTGRPKGVMIGHDALAGLIRWHHEAFGTDRSDRAALLCRVGFDASILEQWPHLTAGACLVVVPEDARTAAGPLIAWLRSQRIARILLPTAVAEAVFRHATAPDLPDMRQLLLGGDRLTRRPPCGLPYPVYNLYGPAECTVVATVGLVSPTGLGNPDIGYPIADTVVRVVPDATVGELYLGGPRLAHGYVNGASTLDNAFAFIDGERFYATGDLVARRPDGAFDFLGRVDDQVSLSGIRVESGEVQAALLTTPAIADAAVFPVPVANGARQLAAFIVPTSGKALDAEAVRAHLETTLPAYMVPVFIRFVGELPRNTSDKVDRAALTALLDGGPATEASTEVERALLSVWRSMFEIDDIGVDDDFFELGGDSIMATALAQDARDAHGLIFSVEDIMRGRSVRAVAALVVAE